MTYHQLTSAERYMISALRKQGLNQSEIGANLGRHRSTICRELKRNASRLGHYRPSNAIEMTSGRRARSRRNLQFDYAQFKRVEDLLREYWSPEQISGHLRREREFLISHETIYRYIIVERKTGYLLIGKLRARTQQQLSKRAIRLIRQHTERFRTITADNGTEFHDYQSIERATNVPFFFCTPHHSWERGTNENTNGLIRQYIPKGTSMAKLDQYQCNAIARQLNRRPRKRLGFKTPEECFYAD